MLPSDLDNEQRANIAHEHPIDVVDSGTSSSPASERPSLFHPQPRPKSASRHRTRTPGDLSNSHFLARLLARDDEVREIHANLLITNERLEAESTRASAAERRALDYFSRLRIATEARERAEQESAKLREELRLYKLQLENAHKEIFRAQDIINQVSAQRNEAEADAARARTKARKLQEEKLVMLAREEGRRLGYREGLSIGRRIGSDEEEDHIDDVFREDDQDVSDQEERRDQRPQVSLRASAPGGQQSIRSGSAPPERTYDAVPHVPPPPIPTPILVTPTRVRSPAHEFRTPSPPQQIDKPETIHPIPIRPSPIIPTHPLNAPSDGWIPRADSRTSSIPVPPPHPPSPSTATAELHGSRATHQPQTEPSSLPPLRSRDYAYPPSEAVPVPRPRAPSVTSRTSTHISQYDLVNKRPGSSLRNEIYAGRARSGSQPSRASTSRNDHQDQEHRHSQSSTKTEAESIVEQWRANPDVVSTATPTRNPPRPSSSTPSVPSRQHYPLNYYYRPRDVATPSPLGDTGAHTPVPVEPSATPSTAHPSEEESSGAHTSGRWPLDYLRQRFRQRPASSSTVPDIIVESPSEPETNLSPSNPVATHPDLLSPESANRPLPPPADDHHKHHQPYYHPSHHQPLPIPTPSRQHQHQHHQNAYDNENENDNDNPSQHPWRAGFVPHTHRTPSRLGKEQEHSRSSHPYHDPHAQPHSQPHAHARSGSVSRGSERYEASPVPPGVTYPAPPVRPQTAQRRRKESLSTSVRDVEGGYGDKDMKRDSERGRYRERDGDGGGGGGGRRPRKDSLRDEQGWNGDKDKRRESERGWYRERDGDGDERTESPAPLQRPISLFDDA